MKKLFFSTLCALACLTLSCQNSTVHAPTQTQQVSTADTNTTAQNAVDSEGAKDDQATRDTDAPESIAADDTEIEEAPSAPSKSNAAPDRVLQIPKTGPKAFVSPGLKQASKHVKLTIKSHKQEDISPEEWFAKNNFVAPSIHQTIEGYTIQAIGVNVTYSYEYNQLLITDPKGKTTLFDFINYFIKDNTWGFSVTIHYATIKDDILYVSLAQPTYANMNPDTAFILALDMDGNILWRSNTLVSNANNFLIIDDTIICGYGFTNEPDYIYTLDRNTGKTIKKLRIKNGPNNFILTDKDIRVLTYDQDYTITYQ